MIAPQGKGGRGFAMGSARDAAIDVILFIAILTSKEIP